MVNCCPVSWSKRCCAARAWFFASVSIRRWSRSGHFSTRCCVPIHPAKRRYRGCWRSWGPKETTRSAPTPGPTARLASVCPRNWWRTWPARSAGRLQARWPATELLQGRPIKIADGTTLSMPDTPENQKAYPQPPHQKPGLGFPILRMLAVISLSCGVVLDVAVCRYCGKKTGETALLRQLFGQFQKGEVALADALFANYWTIAALLKRGVDVIARHDGKRPLQWRVGKRLGKKDHRVLWKKPAKPDWMSRKEYHRMPAELCLRELAVQVTQPGFRTQQVVIVTSLLEAKVYPQEEVARAYRARWQAELDLRAIKQVMAMEILRCKTPPMVRKEIFMHLLAYNLIRTLLAEAAETVGLPPRELSFKGRCKRSTPSPPSGPGSMPPRNALCHDPTGRRTPSRGRPPGPCGTPCRQAKAPTANLPDTTPPSRANSFTRKGLRLMEVPFRPGFIFEIVLPTLMVGPLLRIRVGPERFRIKKPHDCS